MTRIGLVIGHRDFRFGDPYFRCPECGEQSFYNDSAGECYTCRVPFLTLPTCEEPKREPNYTAIALGLLGAAAVVWLTARGKPKP